MLMDDTLNVIENVKIRCVKLAGEGAAAFPGSGSDPAFGWLPGLTTANDQHNVPLKR